MTEVIQPVQADASVLVSNAAPDVTIVFPIQTQKAEIDSVLGALGSTLERLGYTWECILVFDGIKGALWEHATELQERTRDQVRTIALHKAFGESVCLSSAFEHARGGLILTTPPYVQTDPDGLQAILESIDDGADFVTTRRIPRIDSRLNQLQSFAVAYRQGFRVDEVDVRHLAEWGDNSVFGPGIYLRRALDVLGLMFLARFTHKPLRFFGSLGGTLMFAGALLVSVALVEWALRSGDFSLYKTPFFLVGVLMGVLGAQIVGFGLVGEIIVFTQARNVREYRIERIYE